MSGSLKTPARVLVVVALLLVAAACTSKSAKTTTSPITSSAPAGPATVKVASSSLGDILVDGSGRTLYLFLADKGKVSACYSGCATAWPPLLTKGPPVAGSGVTASKLGTTTRTDGKTEVTYAGHPLYYYAPDTSPGMVTGQALNQFGGLWYVVSPSGRSITTKPASSPSSTSPSPSAPSGY